MRLTLRVWRQDGPDVAGDFETYEIGDVTHEMSFLELLDSLNEKLVTEGREPVAFRAMPHFSHISRPSSRWNESTVRVPLVSTNRRVSRVIPSIASANAGWVVSTGAGRALAR